MPELPDLLYIEKALREPLVGRRVTQVHVFEPVVLRVEVAGGFAAALTGRRVQSLQRRGAFLRFALPPVELIVHFMLAGRFSLRPLRGGGGAPRRQGRSHCFSLLLDEELELAYADERRMGRVYLVPAGSTAEIPGFDSQGVDPLSPAFTFELFGELARGRRQQARVFLMDHTALAAIGNAYADEILFRAGIHPKTRCHELGPAELKRLYESIDAVLRWGSQAVEAAGRPVEEKVRGHLKVRGRHGEPCPVCGTTIRKVGVLGYDAYFCPRCQPARRRGLVPWDTLAGDALPRGAEQAPPEDPAPGGEARRASEEPRAGEARRAGQQPRAGEARRPGQRPPRRARRPG